MDPNHMWHGIYWQASYPLHQTLGQKVTWQDILVTTINIYLPPQCCRHTSVTLFPEQLRKSGVNCNWLLGRGCLKVVMRSVTYYCYQLNRTSVEILPDHWKILKYLLESIWIYSTSGWTILTSLCFVQRSRIETYLIPCLVCFIAITKWNVPDISRCFPFSTPQFMDFQKTACISAIIWVWTEFLHKYSDVL